MVELTGEAYAEMLKKLDSEALVVEMIKQSVLIHDHMRDVQMGLYDDYDGDKVFRYNAVYTELINRLEK